MVGPSRYQVYAVQIRSRCEKCKRRRKPGMRCCIYVGYTSKTPKERLEQHLNPPANFKRTVVTQCGGTLRPDLAPRKTFSSQEQALSVEASLAAYLIDRGYTVFGGLRPKRS
jgi:hypothetical protein